MMIKILRENPHLSQLMPRDNESKRYIDFRWISERHGECYSMFGFWPYLASMDFFIKVLPIPFYFTVPEFTFKIKKKGWRTYGILGGEEEPSYVRHIGEGRKILVVK